MKIVAGEKINKKVNIGNRIVEILIGILLITSVNLVILEMADLKKEGLILIAFGVFAVTLFAFIHHMEKISKYVLPTVLFLVAIFAVINISSITGGLINILNLAIESINRDVGNLYIPFSSTSQGGVLLVLILWDIVAAVIISYSIVTKRALISFLLTGAITFTIIYFSENLNWMLLATMTISWLLLLLNTTCGEGILQKKALAFNRRNLWDFQNLILLLAILLLVAYMIFYSPLDFTRSKAIESAREKVVEFSQEVRYENILSKDSQSLFQGDLTKTAPITYKEEKVMSIKMSTLAPMYLKGFVGTEYKDNKWTNGNRELYGGEYLGINSWLLQNGFYPQGQIQGVFKKMEDYKFTKVEVENINANRKYIYAPYELLPNGDTSKEKVNYVEDYGIYSKGIFGEDRYKFTAFVNPVLDYEIAPLKNWVNTQLNKPIHGEYLNLEGVYRSFVFNTYLDVAKKEKELVTAFSQYKGKREEDVLFAIRKLFTENYKYDLETKKAKGKNELKYFATEGKTGNDMHFATLATLMFREAGIPARYVEGYYLSSRYIDEMGASANSEIAIPDSLSHAWVEIYIEGYGFAPVEVVPGFFTLNKEESSSDEAIKKLQQEEKKFYQDKVPVYKDPTPDNKLLEFLSKPWVIATLIILMLIVIFEILGRRRLRKTLSAFDDDNSNLATIAMYKFNSKILRFKKIDIRKNPYSQVNSIEEAFGKEERKAFENLVNNIYMIRYGKEKKVSDNAVEEIKEYTLATRERVYKDSNCIKKLYLRFVRFLY